MASYLLPSCSSCFRLLLDFTEQKNLRKGRVLHAHIVKTALGLASNNYLTNSLVNMYAKCGQLLEAQRQFEEIENRDVVSWNCLISGHAQHGCSVSVLQLFPRMIAEGVLPNPFTFAGVFTAVAHLSEELRGREAHSLAIKSGNISDVFVGSSLLNMYCKLDLLFEARQLFDRMPERNSVTWAAMISGYATERCERETLELFELMLKEEVSVNEFVFTSVLSAFVLPSFEDHGKLIHAFVIKTGYVAFLAVGNALVTMYAKCGSLDASMQMFESLSEKNSITWSAIITGHAQNDKSEGALRLFSTMHGARVKPSEFTLVGVLNACSNMMALSEGKQIHDYLLKLGYVSQIFIRSALVDMYAKCESVNDARKEFDQLQEPDIVLWSSMIGGYVQNGQNEEALTLYGRMEVEHLLPNELTMASVLRACSNLAALEQGKQVHARTIKYGLGLEIPIGSALANMYAKCGSLQDGNLVFRRMPQRDVVSWNSMISGLSQNGHGKEALELFENMKLEGVEPDSVTFVNLLCACSHMGLVERGWSYFMSMRDDYNMVSKVEHHACMVDLLSRAGMLQKAKEFIESCPVDHVMCLWRILLGACKNVHNYDIGAYAGERLMDLGSQESSSYVLLSSIYASQGKCEDVERVRRMMRLRGVSKEPGCSWIELKDGVHVFVAGDLSHPQIKETCAEVKRIMKHMKDESYRPPWQTLDSSISR
ncbi:pentatricopeptide repeat-containing protein At2g33680-like [Aristolochia californica]|uniref:pentatricopeptide repeat-containing protein At2g33680-like n=1 Tax=Aristolochia californica TaxID=171875 RepID=UPI0035DF49BB